MATSYSKQPSRAAVTREATARVAVAQDLRPNSVLAAPRLRDPGKHFRWVREAVLGQPDQLAVQTAVRDGFRPVMIADLAEDDEFRVAAELLQADPSKSGVLRYGGLIGMVFDEELNERRRAIAQQGVDASASSAHAVFGIEQQVNEGRGGLPVFHEDRGSRVERGAAADPSMMGAV